MASIRIDEQIVKNKKNNLASARNSMYSAINEATGLDVPGELYGEEAYFLRHLREKLISVNDSINQYDSWIDNSLYQINDTLSNVHKDVTSISDIKLGTNDNSVLLK